jgi:HK97 gp10 family phage protein
VAVKMEGWAELDRALGQLPKATARNTLRRVLRKAAAPVRDEMESRAPVQSGTLKGSILVGTRLTRTQARDARKEGKAFAEVHVGTADPAGVTQEFGTFRHPPQPFGVPAWEATKDKALEIIGSELGTEIEKAAARYAKKLARG